METFIPIKPTRRAVHNVPRNKMSPTAMSGRVRSTMGLCWMTLSSPHGIRLPYSRDYQLFGMICVENKDTLPSEEHKKMLAEFEAKKEAKKAALEAAIAAGEKFRDDETTEGVEGETEEERKRNAKLLAASLDTGAGLSYIFTKTTESSLANASSALAFDGTNLSLDGVAGTPNTLFELHCVGLLGELEYYNLFSIPHKKYISFGPRGFVIADKEDSNGAVAIVLGLVPK